MWLWSRKEKKYKECTIKGIYMRKAQKKDILDMIQTLHEAHEEIKNHIDRNNIVSAQDLLAQCQECAVSIGNAIETMEKEDCITIPYIQDYCDLVYQIYEALQNNTDSNANKIYKNLKKQLLRIENSVKNDIPVRKEVVFFPYKASMWDSLESVYLAAKEDPECDAYCVPIPYYDRNPDRSLGQMHYEGNEYPKNIEVIDWQSYNFEERKPDVIYIHNPYDDWNLVTCVHPRFFSSNLKKYTEKLVYIPYFVLQEIEPDDQGTIDQMKHFIWTPGVINADKVIVQSEKMKQIYVNEYLKAAQANGLQGNHLNRKYLEEKFLGLGSPKIDKVLNTKKEDLEIPEEWLKIIQKPDGSWKKIIFYNTSIAALLENNEKMLEKMKDVFRIFKENKDEVALLWRPHPLIESTLSSMRPQLWIEYEKLVKWYKEEGWGIYDDTSDVDRAVVLSDAYYGDASSVVQVYRETGKKVYIQDAAIRDDIIIEKKTGKILTHFIPRILFTTRYKDKLYFIASDYNGLFAIDLATGKTSLLGKMEDEILEHDFLGNAVAIDKYIVICPFNYKRLHVWDLENKREVLVKKNIDCGHKSAYLQQVIQLKDNIILFTPSLGEQGLLFSFEEQGIVGKIDFKSEYKKYFHKKCKNFTIDNGYKYEKEVYFSVINTNFLCKYDIEKDEISFIEIEISDNLWLSVGYNQNLYLLSKSGVIYVWDIELKKIIAQRKVDMDNTRDITYIQQKVIVGDDIYFMTPRNIWCIKYTISRNETKIYNYKKLFKICAKEEENYHFSGQDKEGKIYFVSNENNLAIVDLNNNSTSILPLIFDFKQLEHFWEKKDKIVVKGDKGKIILKKLKD